ncbi:MAG: hypothetical protein ABSG51_18395, partial [Terracidiphilus sp.]
MASFLQIKKTHSARTKHTVMRHLFQKDSRPAVITDNQQRTTNNLPPESAILEFAFFINRRDWTLAVSAQTLLSPVQPLTLAYDRERLEDVGFMTCMTLVLLGNYA